MSAGPRRSGRRSGRRSAGQQKAPLREVGPDLRFRWWRGQDLNLRPSGYEPDELPDCSTPRRTDECSDAARSATTWPADARRPSTWTCGAWARFLPGGGSRSTRPAGARADRAQPRRTRLDHLPGGSDRRRGTRRDRRRCVQDGLRRLGQEVFRADWKEATQRLGRGPLTTTELGRTHAQRRADALVLRAQRAQRAHAANPSAAARLRPLVIVVAGLDALPAAWPSPGTRRDHERHRFITGKLRRAIQVRDASAPPAGVTGPPTTATSTTSSRSAPAAAPGRTTHGSRAAPTTGLAPGGASTAIRTRRRRPPEASATRPRGTRPGTRRGLLRRPGRHRRPPPARGSRLARPGMDPAAPRLRPRGPRPAPR